MSSLTVIDCFLARVLQGPAVLPALWSHLPGVEGTRLGGFQSGESKSTGGAQRRVTVHGSLWGPVSCRLCWTPTGPLCGGRYPLDWGFS